MKFGIFNLILNKFIQTDELERPDKITGWDYITDNEIKAIRDLNRVECIERARQSFRTSEQCKKLYPKYDEYVENKFEVREYNK